MRAKMRASLQADSARPDVEPSSSPSSNRRLTGLLLPLLRHDVVTRRWAS